MDVSNYNEESRPIGVGRFDLVFPRWDGRVRDPDRFGNTFSRVATDAGVECTLHVLRHTFVTQLLRNGVPVHIVSAMAGHKSPTVTLTVCSHVLSGDQEDAASTMDKALQRILASGTDSVPTSR